MENPIIKYFLRFIILILVQIFILNNIQFSGYINPYLYIMFILLLPLNFPKWALLLLAFALGFTIDIFSNTLGLHIIATVAMAFARPTLLKIMLSKKELDTNSEPSIKENGTPWFFTYTLTLTIIHHMILFTLEVFRFNEYYKTIGRIVVSVIFTTLLIQITQYLIEKQRR